MSRTEKLHARDVEMAQELKAHHAVMVADLDRLSADLVTAAEDSHGAGAREALVNWLHNVLIPHAAEEEATTYRAAAHLAEGRLLIDSMLVEHEMIRRVAGFVSSVQDPAMAAAFGRAVFEIFRSHQAKENDLILPLLVDADAVSLSEVLAGAGGNEHHHHGH